MQTELLAIVGRDQLIGTEIKSWYAVFGTDGSELASISNSKNGDLYVIHDNTVVRSIEVKASLKYPNAAISDSELAYSRAEYLIAITTAGIWCCTMKEARKHAREVTLDNGSSFWLIPQSKVKLSSLEDVLK